MKLLKLDMDRQTPVVNRMWEFGVNTCHAPLWLRKDLPLQLREEHETLGFRHVRFHGVLNDDMGVVHPDGSFHFERVIEVYENLLKAGFRPFIELSSMPTALASADSSVCFYRFISAPPRDWRRWYDLILAFTLALTAHFGREEVREWYFEVWNEPDIPFWKGSRDEYFKLYDLARRAVKSVCPEYRVGGPATSKTMWIPEFITHVTTPSADDPDRASDAISFQPTPIRVIWRFWMRRRERLNFRRPVFYERFARPPAKRSTGGSAWDSR